MVSKIEKVKPDPNSAGKPIEIPKCDEIAEDGVWYPPDWFLVKINDIMIRRYGGWIGLDLGLTPYHHIIGQAKNAENIHRKAAILLKEITTTRIFQDGHHRTAYIVTKTFLEKNDSEFGEKESQKIINFIKGVRQYSIDQIEGWLRDGKL